jgi:hypothetical protein
VARSRDRAALARARSSNATANCSETFESLGGSYDDRIGTFRGGLRFTEFSWVGGAFGNLIINHDND